MTDSSGVEGLEHWLTLGGFIFVGVTGLLAWAGGSKEGRTIAAERDDAEKASSVAASVGGAAGAGLIDLNAYRAVIDGIEKMTVRLDAIDAKMARLVELGENQDEREAREQQHKDLSEMLRAMIDDLKADIARGDERRSRRAVPSS